MLETLFLKLLNISIIAGWFVLAVMVFRILFRKVPKAFHVGLWVLVGIRLVLPVSIESTFSMVPSVETIPEEILYATEPMIHSGVGFLNSTVNPILSTSLAPEAGASANPIQIIVILASNVWVLGMIIMMSYTIISYLGLQKRVREAVWIKEDIWVCDRIDSPFILGILRPRIYIPSTLGENELEYVIAHEKAHIRRRDHWWKPFGFLLLTIYWINPMLWIAYILLCKDIELACDEKVIGSMGMESKKPYSMALINCSVSRKSIAACPLAFGEVNVKNRIKSVLNYKKPGFWLIVIAVLISVGIAAAFLTDPVTTDVGKITQEKGYYILEQNEYEFTATIPKDVLTEEAFTNKGQTFKTDEVIVYSTDTTNIYLKHVMLSNESEEYLNFIFDFSYHDLDRNSFVLLPYVKSDQGYTFTIKLKSEAMADGMAVYDQAVMMKGHGPEEQFAISAGTETVKNAWKYISFKLVANELFYRKDVSDLPDLGEKMDKCEEEVNSFYATNIAGKVYRGEKVVYGTRMIDSFIYTDQTMPVFVIEKENLHLLTNDFPEPSLLSSYYDIGQIQRVELDSSLLEGLLDDEFNPWAQDYSAEELYRENQNVYMAVEEGQEHNRFYYIFEQKNGDAYIAFGWEGQGIRYIFKMYETGND